MYLQYTTKITGKTKHMPVDAWKAAVEKRLLENSGRKNVQIKEGFVHQYKKGK